MMVFIPDSNNSDTTLKTTTETYSTAAKDVESVPWTDDHGSNTKQLKSGTGHTMSLETPIHNADSHMKCQTVIEFDACHFSQPVH